MYVPYFSFLSEIIIYHLSFFIITHGAYDIADPSSMQEACHNELSKLTSLATSLPEAQWLECPTARCTGGHGFDSRPGLRFFLCPTLVTN